MKILNDIFKYNEQTEVCGLTKELSTLYILNYFENNNENVVILVSSLYEANNYYKMLQAYTNDVLFFPMDDFLTSVAIAVSPDLKIKRLETLEILKQEPNKKHIVVTSLMGYLKYLPNINQNTKLIVDPSPQNISREIILNTLEKFGYNRETLVTSTGEYAVRGFIIDVFPIDYDKPIRLEFFGDDLESIKEFDENSQRTTKNLKTIEIKSFEEFSAENPSSLSDYMNDGTLFKIDSNQIDISYKNLLNDIFEYNISKEITENKNYMFKLDDLKFKKNYNVNSINMYDGQNVYNYSTKEIINFNSNFDSLKVYCNKELKNKTIIFVLEKDNQIKIIKDLFENFNFCTFDTVVKNKINIVKSIFTKGFIINDYIFISPYDIEKTVNREIKYKNKIKMGRKIKSFTELELGDYIVHESYGIGIYDGLKTLKTNGYEKDFIQLSYLDNDKVYVPIENIENLYKYSSADGKHPKLNKLNSTAWAKKKAETRKKIKDISNELIELYSARSRTHITPYKDYEEEIEFALNFPYTLTDDQEKTIHEIDIDLKKSSPMDRLLCGDVGYGKTEVAFRGMFKSVINGFQVAYLCPTTILSKQQYISALERFKDFPIKIELLNRYVTPKNVTRILGELEEGKVDIIIGTHKLLNNKIKYKNLGLLVIDEEQRFGVTHKEKIKAIKNNVNVLTLSATPIPRTLKMAMSGIRGLSILDTPPVNRYPIQTYVIEENDMIIKDAIYKELTRNGQIFILINNIDNLNRFANKLNVLIPEAKTVIGHGQMGSQELNNVMEAFVNKEYDILICTTIIETGIDIPNVNTIIVIDADKFGLSQLYQIRGRVGRSDKIAYSYLMYNPSKILSETAVKRLDSIKEFTELGSGYKIAMRDLSIRGAGDLLGSEQAGFIDSVGIDLYTKMINEEINNLPEEQVADTKPIGLNFSNHIDDDYVSDETIKIEIHKLINEIKSKNDYDRVKEELEDRFGHINEKIEIYMLKKCVENIVKKYKIKVNQLSNKVTITLSADISNQIDGEKLFLTVYNISRKFELSYKNKEINISLNTNLLDKNYIYYIYDLLSLIQSYLQV